jgi:hypothetical protein
MGGADATAGLGRFAAPREWSDLAAQPARFHRPHACSFVTVPERSDSVAY